MTGLEKDKTFSFSFLENIYFARVPLNYINRIPVVVSRVTQVILFPLTYISPYKNLDKITYKHK